MEGRRVRFRVVVDSLMDRSGGRDCFNVAVRDGDDLGTVELAAGARVEEGMTVERVAREIRHPILEIKGALAWRFNEYTPKSAVRVRD